MALQNGSGLPAPQELLPHSGIALCIDELLELEPGKRAVGLWVPDERYFEGHFPEYPVLPGHWTVEAVNLAGACALLAAFPNVTPLFRESQGKFTGQVKPGDEVILVAEFGEMQRGRMSLSTVEGTGYAKVGNKKVFTANKIKAVWTDQQPEE